MGASWAQVVTMRLQHLLPLRGTLGHLPRVMFQDVVHGPQGILGLLQGSLGGSCKSGLIYSHSLSVQQGFQGRVTGLSPPPGLFVLTYSCVYKINQL